jgi:hypothetical protein
MWLLDMITCGTLLVGVGLVMVVVLAALFIQRKKPIDPGRAAALFQQQREHLEADFFLAAGQSGKPRGLCWKKCDWEHEIVLARDKKNCELTALVGLTIQFEAIEGSDMEGLPAVGNLRHASGVFFFRRGRWRTLGRAVFNLNPLETIEHFKQQYEQVQLS